MGHVLIVSNTLEINPSEEPASKVNEYNVDRNHNLWCRVQDQLTLTKCSVPQFDISGQMG